MDKHHRKYDTETGLENFILRLKEDNDTISYYSGYTDSESKVKLKCNICGDVFERYACSVRQKRKIRCFNCEREATKRKKDIQRNIRELNRKSSKLLESKQISFSICENCGKLIVGEKKYCSQRCMNRKHEHIKSRKRKEKMKNNGEVDNTITLDKLILRDKNICYICGKECDVGDVTFIRDQRIIGLLYPSIDHVIPIARGGTHTWDNVRLAHMICNSVKSDKVLEPQQF